MAAAGILSFDKNLINVPAETFTEPVKRAKTTGLIIDIARKELSHKPVSLEKK